MCCLLATGKKRLTDFVSFPVLKNGVRRAYCIVLDICFICPFGANKKYKAHISKYVRHILKYLRHIFCGVSRHAKMQALIADNERRSCRLQP